MSGGIYGGDEVGALVFDVGHQSMRAGYAGEDTPKVDIPSVVGYWEDEDMPIDVETSSAESKRYNIGTVALGVIREGMEMMTFLKDGMIDDWDLFEKVLDFTYATHMRADSSFHPLLMSEAPWNTRQKREQLTELMFEKFKVPAFYLAKNARLAATCNGRLTGVVLDSGASQTSAIPLQDGYVLTQSIVRNTLGGDHVTSQCLQYLNDKRIDVIPHYMVASKETVRENEKAKFTTRNVSEVSASWHKYMVKNVVQDFQATAVHVSECTYDEEFVAQMPMTHYEFPNGYHQDFGTERFKLSESLFEPSDPSVLGAAQLITNCVSMADVDIRPSLYGTVMVTGGNTLLTGYTERLSRDLVAKSPPSMRLKVISANSTVERKYGAWIGGSIVASLGSFQQEWMSRAEYDETGKNLVEKKCP